MIKVDLSDGIRAMKKVDKFLSDFEKKDVPYIQMTATNNLAFDAMGSARKEVRSKFKGRTMSPAIRVTKATKSDPYATIDLNDHIRWRENALTALGLGRGRDSKSFERALQKAGLLRSTEAVIEDGKVQSWVYVQIMSQLQLNWKAGYDANESASSRKRKDKAMSRAGKSRAVFFIVTSGGVAYVNERGSVKRKKSGLAPGVYARMPDQAKKGEANRIMKFTSKLPKYKKMWDLEEIALKVHRRRGQKHIDEATRRAMAIRSKGFK